MNVERMQVRVVGVVQGVGFRPYVHRLATSLGLCGFVLNDPEGVVIEVEGTHARLLEFLRELPRRKPPAAILYATDSRFVRPCGGSDFVIAPSTSGGPVRAWLLPDLGICGDCRRELLDPADRRYRHPFLNCTHCGPRLTIIDDLPYDRARTAMRGFEMCARCRTEYEDPTDRRFHAQPTACTECGPRLHLGEERDPEEALRRTVALLRDGRIVGVKGLGGYHILVDAGNESAVEELRRRKRRPRKPLALLYADLGSARRHVEADDLAADLLTGPQAPIVLLPRTPRGRREVASSVAVGSDLLGVFLAYTPLHVLLALDFGGPLVATSGNLSDDPTLHDDEDARRELEGVCDALLVHDRPIRRQVDDSVLQIVRAPEARPQLLRRARGYTPLPLLAPEPLPPVLALGGQMNSVFAFAREREIVLSQHLGDLSHASVQEAFRRTLDDLLRLYDVRPERVVHDLHPDYFTTALAEELGLPRVAIQHHHAHFASALLEHRIEGPALGLTFDGTGHGGDGTVWGGEFLLGDAAGSERVGSLWPFRLPGGEAAVRDTWRTGLALAREAHGGEVPEDLGFDRGVEPALRSGVVQILEREVHSPVTTSAGRLFDGVSALLGLCTRNTHQAEAPQQLEGAAWRGLDRAFDLHLELVRGERLLLDWRPAIRALVEACRDGVAVESLAAGFHLALARAAARAAEDLHDGEVVLSGGVFCNRLLTESLVAACAREVRVHSQLPPTDGSLAAGQLWAAVSRDPG